MRGLVRARGSVGEEWLGDGMRGGVIRRGW